MILSDNLIAEELLTTFTVIKVHHEPHAESTWTLQFQDYPSIAYFDKYFQTQEKDEKLVNKRIKAQIHLEVDARHITLITDPIEQKKSIVDVPGVGGVDNYVPIGPIIVTGIYKDDIKDKYYEGIDSCLDSIFPLKITINLGGGNLNLRKGDWVRITAYEHCIDIVRDYTPLQEISIKLR